ncbi:MAG: hydrogenase 4 subunit B [Synergistetes bacterium ADurb.Bin520]|nr:MAG: hydrogenase 4 subunit B [Synergistetes bacterium ADurb.Bin520]
MLCAGCFAIALGAAPVLTGLTPVIEHIAGASRSTIDLNLSLAALQRPLSLLSGLAAALMALGFALLLMRRRLLRRQPPATGVTWDCGYAAPSPRMQYTPSSFGQPLLDPFTPLLNRRLFARIPKALFPASSSLSTGTADLFQQKLFVPFLRSLGRCMDLLRWIQTGRVQIYILYIIIALVGVLLWSVTE